MERSGTRETPQSRTAVSYTSTNPQLPMDIISDILSRLPVKSLLRFKSVSKSCYKLIQSPIFIKQQLNYSQQNPNPIFNSILSSVRESDKRVLRINLIDDLDKTIDLDLPFISGPRVNLIDDLVKTIDLDLSVMSSTRVMPLVILGITDGLVCVMMQPSDICICNPLTGDYKKVPSLRGGLLEVMFTYYGFGLNGDKGYELFRMMYAPFPYDDKVELCLSGKAYSLTTNTWRQINVKRGKFEYLENHSHSFLSNCGHLPVFLRGIFYWGALDSDTHQYVVCFDVESEVFDEFEAPYHCDNAALCKLKDEVAAVVYIMDTAFDIWVLDEKQRTWTLKFAMKDGYTLNVFPEKSMVVVLGCTLSGKLVVQDSNEKESKLFLYDMETERNPTQVFQEKIEILPYVNVGANSSLFFYSESLVSVGASHDVAGADFW